VPAYVAFDLIWLSRADLRPLPLTEHQPHLQNILPKGSAIISEALSVTGRGHKLFVEPPAMEGSAVEGTMMNVVTVKEAEPKREPYRNSVGERRVWVRIVVV
jgi:ATP-dependent DNA ligase